MERTPGGGGGLSLIWQRQIKGHGANKQVKGGLPFVDFRPNSGRKDKKKNCKVNCHIVEFFIYQFGGFLSFASLLGLTARTRVDKLFRLAEPQWALKCDRVGRRSRSRWIECFGDLLYWKEHVEMLIKNEQKQSYYKINLWSPTVFCY